MPLIECFKAKSPDVKLYADAAQLAAKPDKLIRWSEREAWLAQNKAKAPKEPKAPKDAK